MPPVPSGRIIADVAIADAAELRRLGKTLRAVLARSPLRLQPGMEEVEDPRVVAIRTALAYALAQIDALALPRPDDHADDILRALGMTRAEIAACLGITDGAVKKRRTRRTRSTRRT